MKMKSLFMTAALAAVAMTAFTSCSQNDDEELGNNSYNTSIGVHKIEINITGDSKDLLIEETYNSFVNGNISGLIYNNGATYNSQLTVDNTNQDLSSYSCYTDATVSSFNSSVSVVNIGSSDKTISITCNGWHNNHLTKSTTSKTVMPNTSYLIIFDSVNGIQSINK